MTQILYDVSLFINNLSLVGHHLTSRKRKKKAKSCISLEVVTSLSRLIDTLFVDLETLALSFKGSSKNQSTLITELHFFRCHLLKELTLIKLILVFFFCIHKCSGILCDFGVSHCYYRSGSILIVPTFSVPVAFGYLKAL